jgi:DNA polymerase III subunit delta
MATATEHAFRKIVAAGSFAPVYYLYGDDDFRKDEAVARAVDAAVASSVREFNLDSRRAAELDAETLESLLGTPPMMTDRRAVVVRDLGALRKDARRVLDRYLDRPADDTLLLLVSPAGEKAERALVDRTVGVEFPALTGDRVPKWIAHRASEMGAAIAPEAAGLLQAAVGTELTGLASELDKLVSYMRGSTPGAADGRVTIDEAAVAAVVGVRRGETVGDLLDRVAERDVGGALGLIEHVLAQPKTTAVSLVIALAVQTLALGWGRARLTQGVPRPRLEREYRTLLSETKAYPMRPWDEAIQAWGRTVDGWTEADVERALEALLAADVALKETRVSSDEQIIASLVLAMCAAGDAFSNPGRPTRVPQSVRRGVAA